MLGKYSPRLLFRRRQSALWGNSKPPKYCTSWAFEAWSPKIRDSISIRKAGIWHEIKLQSCFLIHLETMFEERRKDGALGLAYCWWHQEHLLGERLAPQRSNSSHAWNAGLDYATEASDSLLTMKAPWLVYSCDPFGFGGCSLVSWLMHPNL